MIDPKEMLATLVDHLAVTAQVQNVFGEPIEAHGKTVVPIARVSYCLGAGGGGGADSESEKTNGGVGALEITEAGTRFVGVFDRRRAAGFVAGGIAIGLALRRILRWR
jgi:uncharacterized spore protein YtfJ